MVTLEEKDFIHEPKEGKFSSFLLWVCLTTLILSLLWGGKTWYWDWISERIGSSPFLKVTNRDLSLFLWQFPEQMRANQKQKSGYLPGFEYLGKEILNPTMADKYAIAPPETLFLYHTWHRLLFPENSQAVLKYPILKTEFEKFIQDNSEWQPIYWKEAPSDYVEFLVGLKRNSFDDLQKVPVTQLPIVVRLAFQGWKNYFIDGEAINAFHPTFAQLKLFLENNPHYGRSYWRNIVAGTTPNYLKTAPSDSADVVPGDQLTPFLKYALYSNNIRSNG